MKHQVHVYYSGTVQGVGFRFTAEEIAEELGLTGWVSNLDDGRVELVAEGDQKILKIFLENIEKRFSRYITDRSISWEDATGKFDRFRIAHP